MAKKDYYEILGVSKNANDSEIKSAFRNLAKKYHPDVSKEENAEAKFKEAQEAYAVLSDTNRRKQYDQFGHAAFDNNASGGGGSWSYNFDDIDLGSIFDDLMGNFTGSFSSFGGSRRNHKSKGSDTLTYMTISFMEAILGTKKPLDLSTTEECSDCSGNGGFDKENCDLCHGSGSITAEQRTIFGSFLSKTTCHKCNGTGFSYKNTCNKCSGKGRVKINKSIDVEIPAGVNTGNQIRLSGFGNASPNGGPNGDLYIEFRVQKHDIYERDGDDLLITLPITITEAILGTKKNIKLPDSNITLTVPAGSDTGDKHRIKNKGIKDVNYNRYGDLYIIIKVITPKKLSKEDRKSVV